jgi:hypothetical protein
MMEHFQLVNHTVYCYTGGKPFDPAQAHGVFIHGVLNDHSVWILQTRYLAHHGWNVLALDLPGHWPQRRRGARPASRRPRTSCGAVLDAAGRGAGRAGRPQLGLADRAGGGGPAGAARQPPGAGGHGLPHEGVARAARRIAQRPGRRRSTMVNVFSRSTLAPPCPRRWARAPGCTARAWRWARACWPATRKPMCSTAASRPATDYANGEAAMAAIAARCCSCWAHRTR